MRKLLYWGEMLVAPVLSVLLVSLSQTMLSPILFALGVLTATFAEYTVHAWLLHGLRVTQHLDHHRRPDEKIYTIYWPLWLLLLPTLLISPAFTGGALAGYWYYLYVHHLAHHDPDKLSASLLSHHRGHHSKANTNYGVSTTMWDRFFRTKNNGSH